MKKFSRILLRKPQTGIQVEFEPFKQYVVSGDYRRNAIDLVPGWNNPLPPEGGETEELAAYRYDPRITWAIEQHGGVCGAHVLEVGPMEARHTYMLEQAGARIDSVEANRLGFMKCLVAKEIMDLKAKFYLAEINAFLRQSDQSYDLIVACGVLYHMRDPLTLLELFAQKAPALVLWTHFVQDAERANAERDRPPYFSIDGRFGFDVRLFERAYITAEMQDKFCGGVFDHPRWIFRDDLPKALAAVGYDDIRIAHEEVNHPNGPALTIYAQKSD